MAAFQPINFNYGLDTSALGGSFGTPSLVGGVPLGGGNNNVPSFGTSIGASTTAGTMPAGPGNLFSNLFGDGGMFSKQSLFGGTDAKTGVSSLGWAPTALGIGQAIFGGIQGNKAMKMAQDSFKEGKRQFDLNYGAQRQSINTQLEDRQRARVASNPGAYESVGDYLDKNRIK